MARTELPNGVILPAEYSDDWYEDMTSNLTKLDDVIGSDSEKLNADGVDFLRMSSAALTDGGTGNFSDLNSSNKLKTGDYVLDSGRKLYQVVSVDSTNETFTVGNSLFKITAESDLAPVAESGDYDDLDNKPDLNPYDQHIVNTDIHVTTADKTKWNNGVTQSYVFRYSGTAVVPNSTIAYSTIDNTDNIKSGDKILDVDGKLFEITAVDTTNQTVTVGSALIDLALDANVVHTSGNETVSGLKTFANNLIIVGRNTDTSSVIQLVNADVVGDSANGTSGFEVYGSSVSDANKIGGVTVGEYSNNGGSYTLIECNRTVSGVKSSNVIRSLIRTDGSKELSATVDNDCKLGSAFLRWSKIYGTEYYYGSNNVEFSTKFVTTDTAQTITGSKTFSSNINVYNSDSTGNVSNLVLKNSKAEVGTDFAEQSINFVDKNNNPLAKISCYGSSGNYTRLYITASDSNNNSEGICIRKSTTGTTILPTTAGAVALGNSSAHFYNVQTSRVNGLTPSSLGLPSNTGYVDISGYFTNTGDGQTNSYTASVNGWIYLNVVATRLIMQIRDSNDNNIYADMRVRSSDGTIYMTIPIGSGNKLLTQWFTSSSVTVTTARFIPCQGNI